MTLTWHWPFILTFFVLQTHKTEPTMNNKHTMPTLHYTIHLDANTTMQMRWRLLYSIYWFIQQHKNAIAIQPADTAINNILLVVFAINNKRNSVAQGCKSKLKGTYMLGGLLSVTVVLTLSCCCCCCCCCCSAARGWANTHIGQLPQCEGEPHDVQGVLCLLWYCCDVCGWL